MIPFGLGNAMTHAGAGLLCLCCCETDNGGGGQFPDTPTRTPIRQNRNPLVQVLPASVDTTGDSGRAQPGPEIQRLATDRRHRGVYSAEAPDPRQGSSGRADLSALPDDDYLDWLGLIALIEADE